MKIIQTKYVVEAPAGEYYLGDPCYAFTHLTWDALMDSSDSLRNAIATNKRGSFVAFSTAHGDGEYRDGKGCSYPVDSGIIGLVPVEMIDRGDTFKLEECGRRVKFGMPVKCWEADGVLHFGHYAINTNTD